MKKKVLLMLAVMLCAAAVWGYLFIMDASSGHDTEIPRFSEMEYVRPDVKIFEEHVAEAEKALSGWSYSRAVKCLNVCFTDYGNYDTMCTLADIRSNLDMTDSYYFAESTWCDENFYTVKQLMEELYYACAESRHAAKLETDYFWDGFCEEYSIGESGIYDNEAVALMQKESVLVAEYYALGTDPVIRMDGDEVHLNDYTENPGSYDYARAMNLYYEQYNSRYADIYIELIKTRNALAELQGYESYEQMAYEYNFERDYTPEQAWEYIAAVKAELVPLYKAVMSTNPYAYVDYYDLSSEENETAIAALAADLGGSVEEAFAFMREYELYDITQNRNKAKMSYQTYLTDYDAPYLFLCPEGTVEDILGFAHEFGHYAESYVNYNSPESIDLAECFSQSMEYLALCCLGDTMDEGAMANLSTIKMLDTLELYVQQTSFAEFEHVLYSTPEEELSAEFINALSLKLAMEYGYYSALDRDYYSYSWVDIVHFFEQPFYVISYPVSNDIAMQIFELELAESGRGAEKYFEMLQRESGFILEAAAAAELESPFAAGRMQKNADTILAVLAG